jgi:hypothetical protein
VLDEVSIFIFPLLIDVKHSRHNFIPVTECSVGMYTYIMYAGVQYSVMLEKRYKRSNTGIALSVDRNKIHMKTNFLHLF